MGYAVSEEIDIKLLYNRVDSFVAYVYRKDITDEFIYLAFQEDKWIFVFKFGVVVCWCFDRREIAELLQSISGFYRGDPRSEIECMTFTQNEKFKIEGNVLNLEREDPIDKLAVSYAMAQSIQLSILENLITISIQKTSAYQRELRDTGTLCIGRYRIKQLIGKLFGERAYVNLHSSLLDTPDCFWDYDEAYAVYQKMHKYYDMEKRLKVLNRRLDLISEMLNLLNDIVTSQHSSALEQIMLALIMVEVFAVVGWNIILKDVLNIV